MASAGTLYLVRHAKAGERRAWTGDDQDRPLSKAGWKQAAAIGDRLARLGATSLHSSPYLRCVQTLEPLGSLLDTPVDDDMRLAEGKPFEPALELLADVGDGAVLCSHGDLIPAIIEALQRRGTEIVTAADWRKGSIWVLTRKGRRITKAKVWPPTR